MQKQRKTMQVITFVQSNVETQSNQIFTVVASVTKRLKASFLQKDSTQINIVAALLSAYG